MSIYRAKAAVTALMQHPRAPLVLVLFTCVFLLALTSSWWHWQETAQKELMQAMRQQQQLQALISQLPTQVALVTGSEEMMSIVSRHPLPSGLQSKVGDIRLVNNQLKAQVNQANATELFSWLSQLSQSGLLVSKLTLERSPVGLVSGSIEWGSL